MTHSRVRGLGWVLSGVISLATTTAFGLNVSWADYGGPGNSNGNGGCQNGRSGQNCQHGNQGQGNQGQGNQNPSHGGASNGDYSNPRPSNPRPEEIGDAPSCMAKNQSLAVNNTQVASWKSSTPNQYLARAYVTGRVSEVYPDRNGHKHFSISLDGTRNVTLEVVYNDEFGECPAPKDGQTVSACGDYITSTKATAQYQPSPDGAIIHWVHMAPNPDRHDSGFLTINGSLCGMVNPNGSGGRRQH